MPTNGSTPNFALTLPYGGRQNWTDLANGNFRLIDAILATFVSVNNIVGLWTNNTAYTVGQNVVDETSGVIYTAQVNHTSAGAPTTFLEERTNNPTYWLTFATAARNRGSWQTATAYSLNDFVLADGTKYAMAIEAHTSGANFTADLAAGKWEVMIDLSTAGSLVLPVLSGSADANKIVMSDTNGTSYVINTTTVLASLLNAAGLATLANPTFTGSPIAPTQTAESNDTKIATDEYVDRAIRSLIVRTQTFAANGTYTPNSKMIYCKIEAWAGGGGGGSTASAANIAYHASGGGSGAYSMLHASNATIGVSKAVTIGSGGAGATAGTNAGSAGTDTSVGTLCVAKGGSGGPGFTSTAPYPLGGLGGLASGGTGDLTLDGNRGGGGQSIAFVTGSGAYAGAGAGAPYISGPVYAPAHSAAAVAGNNGRANSGQGGSSAWCLNGSDAAGGDGGSGFVMITEYCYG